MNERVCTKCEVARPLSDFSIRNGKPWYWCKPCQREKSKSYRQRFPERIKAQNDEYRKKNPGYSAAYSRKWRSENRERYLASLRDQYRKNTQKDPLWNFRRNIRKDYGISVEQYDTMYRAQNGVCAICSGLNLSGRRLAVDHDHATGKIRGLLCSRCNSAIGLARENKDILKQALSYLEKHETIKEICG